MAYCSNCGRELADGANFCFKCGSSVGEPSEATRRTVFSGEIHKCPQCGEVLNAYEGVCGACGYELRGGGVSDSVQKFAEQLKTATTEYQKATIIQGFPIPNNREDIFEFLILASSSIDKHLNNAVLAAWVSKIEQSYKKAKLVLRQEQDLDQVEEIYAEAQEKIQELTHERIRHKKKPSLPQQPPQKKRFFRWSPMTTVGMALGFIIIIVVTLVALQEPQIDPNSDPSSTVATEQSSEQNGETGLLSLDQGREYTFGIDKSDVYVATVISDTVIKVEKWSRGLFLQMDYSMKYDAGAYRVDDPKTGFCWLDDEHSVFRLVLKDQREFSNKRGHEVIFTESWADGNQYKGSHCLDDVFYYQHQHDDSHLYKAVAVSDGLLKIECWIRNFGVGDFHYGYDVCVIALDGGDMGLKWSDEERNSFTMNLQDQRGGVKEPAFVVFEKHN